MKKRHKSGWTEDADRELASIPTLAAVEKAIGIKAAKWRNRCHEIACLMLKAGLVAGEERYGHYYGIVSTRHPRYGLPFQRHGWIETPRGLVVDPTRWTFRMVKPYIYYGPDLDYDAGGQRMASANVRPYPPGPHDEAGDSPNLTDEQRAVRRKVIQLDVTGPARRQLAGLTGGQTADFSIDQVFWLANLPLPWWHGYAGAVYAAIEESGHRAAIPYDNWRMATGSPLAKHTQ